MERRFVFQKRQQGDEFVGVDGLEGVTGSARVHRKDLPLLPG